MVVNKKKNENSKMVVNDEKNCVLVTKARVETSHRV